jgi:hypothetical protein
VQLSIITLVDDERCPDCGSSLTSLDEPCPHCSSWAEPDDGEVVPYVYSKTFTLHCPPFRRYRPDPFVAEINEWLAGERGLLDVSSLVINRSVAGLVTDVTLSCMGINKPTSRLFQIERLVLVKGDFRRRGTTLGEGLNSWREMNPGRRLLRFVSLSAAGVSFEVWLLFVEVVPAAAPAIEVPPR